MERRSRLSLRLFASKELIPGDTWKVYLKASDPDGDLIISSQLSISQVGDYPVSRTRIREENGKEINVTSI